MQKRALGSLWIGSKLGPLEQLCLLSFLEHGHDITLYTYETVAGVPPGVRIADARTVLDFGGIVRHKKTQSAALHSDLFRYALLEKTPRMWVDLDMFCLQPFVFAGDHVYGKETTSEINGAVLALPADSAVLRQLRNYQPGLRAYPPFFRWRDKLRYFLKFGGRKPDITEWPWGAVGPRGLSYHLRLNGDFDKALPVQAFYPLPLEKLGQLLEPGRLTREHFGEDVFGVHLWASQLRKLLLSDVYQGQILEGSFLQLEMSRLGTMFDFPLSTRVQ